MFKGLNYSDNTFINIKFKTVQGEKQQQSNAQNLLMPGWRGVILKVQETQEIFEKFT